MGYFLRCDTPLEISVADFISARYVRKSDGEIPFAVVGKVCLTAFSFCQYVIYTSFLQVRELGRRRQLHDVKLLETRLGGRLPVKRERHGTDMRCLFLYAFQDIRNTLRCVEVCRQCDDVAALSQTEIKPLFTLCVYLERGLAFIPEWGTCTRGLPPAALRGNTPDCADSLRFLSFFASSIVIFVRFDDE